MQAAVISELGSNTDGAGVAGAGSRRRADGGRDRRGRAQSGRPGDRRRGVLRGRPERAVRPGARGHRPGGLLTGVCCRHPGVHTQDGHRFAGRAIRGRSRPNWELPPGDDDAMAAALGIAGLAGWLAVEERAHLQAGERVLVLGATGTVGSVAVQAAKLLGASRIVAVGRDSERLARSRELGADETVYLGEAADMEQAFRGGLPRRRAGGDHRSAVGRARAGGDGRRAAERASRQPRSVSRRGDLPALGGGARQAPAPDRAHRVQDTGGGAGRRPPDAARARPRRPAARRPGGVLARPDPRSLGQAAQRPGPQARDQANNWCQAPIIHQLVCGCRRRRRHHGARRHRRACHSQCDHAFAYRQ